MYARRPFLESEIWSDRCECTLVKDHLNVIYARKPFLKSEIWSDTCEGTLVKDRYFNDGKKSEKEKKKRNVYFFSHNNK
jgi:hypothetical protein